MKCAKGHFIFTMVNAVVDSKCQCERSEIVAHFESQTVLQQLPWSELRSVKQELEYRKAMRICRENALLEEKG